MLNLRLLADAQIACVGFTNQCIDSTRLRVGWIRAIPEQEQVVNQPGGCTLQKIAEVRVQGIIDVCSDGRLIQIGIET